ncbi:hypothetical protein ABW636_05620 [Aquimarina sp. 2201CG1-2-11]|uniref:hypothetical protein n=1 Tax=Aquimarina discodermiae TaxID=3231043 RepID=UPI0034636686
MKRLLLPIVLIAFAVVCLGIVHIDNINEINSQSDELRKKHQGFMEKRSNTENTNTISK